MADFRQNARQHGTVQVVESSLPPMSKKKAAVGRKKAATVSGARPQDGELQLAASPGLGTTVISSSASSGGAGAGAGAGGGGAVAAAPEIVLVDKQSICVEILAAGFVQSFVDFFYLTHRPDPVQEAYAGTTQEVSEIDVSIDDMEVIKTHLVDAEAARRKPDQVDAVYDNLNSLAAHFQSREDQRTGIYFYEKCLEIARIMQDAHGEMKATYDLGSAYQVMKDYVKAVEYVVVMMMMMMLMMMMMMMITMMMTLMLLMLLLLLMFVQLAAIAGGGGNVGSTADAYAACLAFV
jgi:hypothetical protein